MPVYAEPLVWADGIPRRRPGRGGLQCGRAFDEIRGFDAQERVVRRQCPRRRDLAILASLVNTAKLNDVDPEAWLGDALERIVSGEVTINRLDELLPWRWKAERQARNDQWVSWQHERAKRSVFLSQNYGAHG